MFHRKPIPSLGELRIVWKLSNLGGSIELHVRQRLLNKIRIKRLEKSDAGSFQDGLATLWRSWHSSASAEKHFGSNYTGCYVNPVDSRNNIMSSVWSKLCFLLRFVPRSTNQARPSAAIVEKLTMDMSWDGVIKAEKKVYHSVSYLLACQRRALQHVNEAACNKEP